MAGLKTLSIVTSLIIFCEHFSPSVADFYVETLRKSKTEPGKMFRCPTKEAPKSIGLQLSPTSYADLMDKRRRGLVAGSPPPDEEYSDEDSPPNTQALNFSYMQFEDDDEESQDTQSRTSLQSRGLNMRRLKASLHARSLFTFGRRKSSRGREDSLRSQDSKSKAATKTKGAETQGKSNRNHPSLSLDDKYNDPKNSPSNEDLPPAARKVRSFSCEHVWNIEDIIEVHNRVNFYLVAYPKLPGDNIISLPNTDTPNIFLLGVPLLGETPDWPAFIDGHREDVHMVVTLVRQMFVNLVQPPFLKGLSVDSLAAFMSTANFRHFSRPVPKMVNRLKSFADLQGNVEEYCGTKRAPNNHIVPPEDPVKLAAAESAIRLLVQKMIDPCFMGAEGRSKDPEGFKDADFLCNEHCEFLAVSFAVFPNAVDKPEGCSSAIESGRCGKKPRVCQCKQLCGSSGRCGSAKTQSTPMVKCSNMLRRNILPPISVPGSRKGSPQIPMKWT